MSKVKMMMMPCSPARGNGNLDLEVRPCGMLVQKRTIDSNQNSNVVPTVKIRVKYGSSYHEVYISSQASFGELKKMLAGPTGLHPQDQKLMYKDKERDSKGFLDFAGVKNGSRMVLVEDELNREGRFLESRKSAKMEKSSKEISAIRFEVDKFAKQVAECEMEICRGKKVTELVLLSLIEQLMMQLIKLDGIIADGDIKVQRRMQVKRVQKYIETLDVLKIKNSNIGNFKITTIPKVHFQQHHAMFTGKKQMQKHGLLGERSPGPVVVTTKWETF